MKTISFTFTNECQTYTYYQKPKEGNLEQSKEINEIIPYFILQSGYKLYMEIRDKYNRGLDWKINEELQRHGLNLIEQINALFILKFFDSELSLENQLTFTAKFNFEKDDSHYPNISCLYETDFLPEIDILKGSSVFSLNMIIFIVKITGLFYHGRFAGS